MTTSPVRYSVLPLAPGLREDVFQTRVVELATELRIRWHHETDSRRTRKGWPDLYLCGSTGTALVELKTDDVAKSHLTDGQAGWLADVVACRQRQTVAVWRPRDWAFNHAALHRLAGRRVPDIAELTGLTRHRLRYLDDPDPTGRAGSLTGDFSTRIDAEAVRKALPDPNHAEVVACDAHGRPLQEQP